MRIKLSEKEYDLSITNEEGKSILSIKGSVQIEVDVIEGIKHAKPLLTALQQAVLMFKQLEREVHLVNRKESEEDIAYAETRLKSGAATCFEDVLRNHIKPKTK